MTWITEIFSIFNVGIIYQQYQKSTYIINKKFFIFQYRCVLDLLLIFNSLPHHLGHFLYAKVQKRFVSYMLKLVYICKGISFIYDKLSLRSSLKYNQVKWSIIQNWVMRRGVCHSWEDVCISDEKRYVSIIRRGVC